MDTTTSLTSTGLGRYHEEQQGKPTGNAMLAKGSAQPQSNTTPFTYPNSCYQKRTSLMTCARITLSLLTHLSASHQMQAHCIRCGNLGDKKIRRFLPITYNRKRKLSPTKIDGLLHSVLINKVINRAPS